MFDKTVIENYNPMYNTNFRLEIVGAPQLNFFMQNVNLPSINSAGIETPYKNFVKPIQSDRIDYDPLNVTFTVDEDLENYLFLFNWMKDSAYKERPIDFTKDITLHLLTNNKTQNIKVIFYDAFPVSLGELSFDSTVTDPTPIICTCMFRYLSFSIERV